ncbi:MAG TPA: DUF1778 domain-containing protein [Nitrospira sp.]|nr:DUF1778 domain-containing protein [Nitrospira sp.]
MATISATLNSASGKTARLEARITKQQKAFFLRAAQLAGLSLTDFVVASAQENASRTLRDHDAMVLSDRDRKAFVSALLTAPEPSTRLRQAVQRYKARQQRGTNAR